MPKKATRTAARTSQKLNDLNGRVAPAAASAAVTARTPVTPGTMQSVRVPLDVQLAPDGKHVAFILREWVPERARPRGRLWIVATNGADGGEPRPLAVGAGEDACPRWSPDGARLAFLSKRDNEHDQPDENTHGSDAEHDAADGHSAHLQLYVTSVKDGAARDTRRVCALPNGASDLAWSPDGTHISLISREGPKPSKDPIAIHADRHRRLWTVRPESDSAEPVTPPNITVWEYAWSPESRRIAVYFTTGPDETDYYRGQVGIVPAGGGAVRQVTQLTRQAAALTWSPDGSRLVYVSGEWSDRGIVGGDVYTLEIEDDRARGEPQNLTPGITCSPSWVRWLPDGKRLLYAAWDGLAHQIGVLDEATGKLTPLQQDFVIGDWSWPRLTVSADMTRVAAAHASREHPADVYVGKVKDEGITWRRISRLNPLAEETLAVAPAERIDYASVDGTRIEALFTPPVARKERDKKAKDTRDTGKPPLALVVHGGPSGAYQDTWLGGFLTQLLAGAGYAVLRPNPRGSMGRGVAFTDAVLGDMGGKDLQDVLRGVDEVIARGLVDGERVAILGWSYGGFMVAWAVTQTTRFKAAMMGAGICDFHSFHAESNIPDWDMRFLRADPSEQPEAYRERSAITFVTRITTPTLIIHGEHDLCVPVNQAYAFHRALVERGVQTELAVYPREGHGFQEREHIKDMEQRLLRWLDTHV
jgi:dipeptidyl aminopeptidase/acylaminoacyl peptidase